MTVQDITLHLSDTTFEHARLAAKALQRPIEEVLSDALAAAFPNIQDAPQNMQRELAELTWLSDQDLWKVARSAMSVAHQQRLRQLGSLGSAGVLTPDELAELESLRDDYGRTTLRKARAFALLSMRGGRPLLAPS
mgnify:FL=1